MPETTPEFQRNAAEAARKDGDQNGPAAEITTDHTKPGVVGKAPPPVALASSPEAGSRIVDK